MKRFLKASLVLQALTLLTLMVIAYALFGIIESLDYMTGMLRP